MTTDNPLLSLSDDFADTLRGLGMHVVTCLNCASPQLGLNQEVYSLQITDPDRVMHFDVRTLRQLVTERGAEPTVFQPGDANYLWLLWWLGHKCQLNLPHIDHIPLDRLEEPGLRVWVLSPEGSADGQPQPFPLLVDGTHRLLKKVMLGLPVAVYDVNGDAERDAVLTWTEGIDRELWPDAPKGRSNPDGARS